MIFSGWATLAAGAWLVVSPWALKYEKLSRTVRLNAVISGVCVAAFSLASLILYYTGF